MKRNRFLQLSFGALGLLLVNGLKSCSAASKKGIRFILSGTNAAAGHLVRQAMPENAKITTDTYKDIVIVGGGVSGLSTAYFLEQKGIADYILLELDEQAGGNSKSGSNSHSKYPYGAHYLPIPNPGNTSLLKFLEEKKLITGYDKGQPIYDEYALCHDPEERLLVSNFWHEGLVPPTQELSKDEQEQFASFFGMLEKMKNEKGADGKYVFEIPLSDGSKDHQYGELDKISFEEYLQNQKYTSKDLLWYLNYCCRDDYGQPLDKVSAFAGLHYFAARRGKGANCEENAVLTWPEGNGHLVTLLSEHIQKNIHPKSVVRKVETEGDGCSITYTNWEKNEHHRIRCKKVVMAVPYFVRKRLLPEPTEEASKKYEPQHQPWLVSNITVTQLQDKNGYALCWDNVFKDSETLGYVYAQHQSLGRTEGNYVLTLYKPLDKGAPTEIRKKYREATPEALQQEVISDLKKIYPNIEEAITEMDCRLWGHGMVSPGIDYLCNAARMQLSAPIEGKIFFAHTDYAGISIFEEAFRQGQDAAEQIIKAMPHA